MELHTRPALTIERRQFWIPVSHKTFSQDAGWDQIKIELKVKS